MKVLFYRVGVKQDPSLKDLPFLDSFPQQFLKFLTEQVKSKLVFVTWEYTVKIKILKVAGKRSKRGQIYQVGGPFFVSTPCTKRRTAFLRLGHSQLRISCVLLFAVHKDGFEFLDSLMYVEFSINNHILAFLSIALVVQHCFA